MRDFPKFLICRLIIYIFIDFKRTGPLYLVIPGIIAAVMLLRGFNLGNIAADGTLASDKAYGSLVNFVLPEWLAGFFAAVLLGAILSSFNSALNSTCTLFSLGIYKRLIHPEADDHRVVRAGRWFGVIITLISVGVAPLLAETGGIFNYLQKMNAIYFIPILTVVAFETRTPVREPSRYIVIPLQPHSHAVR